MANRILTYYFILCSITGLYSCATNRPINAYELKKSEFFQTNKLTASRDSSFSYDFYPVNFKLGSYKRYKCQGTHLCSSACAPNKPANYAGNDMTFGGIFDDKIEVSYELYYSQRIDSSFIGFADSCELCDFPFDSNQLDAFTVYFETKSNDTLDAKAGNNSVNQLPAIILQSKGVGKYLWAILPNGRIVLISIIEYQSKNNRRKNIQNSPGKFTSKRYEYTVFGCDSYNLALGICSSISFDVDGKRYYFQEESIKKSNPKELSAYIRENAWIQFSAFNN